MGFQLSSTLNLSEAIDGKSPTERGEGITKQLCQGPGSQRHLRRLRSVSKVRDVYRRTSRAEWVTSAWAGRQESRCHSGNYGSFRVAGTQNVRGKGWQERRKGRKQGWPRRARRDKLFAVGAALSATEPRHRMCLLERSLKQRGGDGWTPIGPRVRFINDWAQVLNGFSDPPCHLCLQVWFVATAWQRFDCKAVTLWWRMNEQKWRRRRMKCSGAQRATDGGPKPAASYHERHSKRTAPPTTTPAAPPTAMPQPRRGHAHSHAAATPTRAVVSPAAFVSQKPGWAALTDCRGCKGQPVCQLALTRKFVSPWDEGWKFSRLIYVAYLVPIIRNDSCKRPRPAQCTFSNLESCAGDGSYEDDYIGTA